MEFRFIKSKFTNKLPIYDILRNNWIFRSQLVNLFIIQTYWDGGANLYFKLKRYWLHVYPSALGPNSSLLNVKTRIVKIYNSQALQNATIFNWSDEYLYSDHLSSSMVDNLRLNITTSKGLCVIEVAIDHDSLCGGLIDIAVISKAPAFKQVITDI